ncbi:hypothetical protein GCM10018780_49400 [Streptomyces lanatus]|nr:hypothetical protein GCM10018780_49400 [Streptomyces lanatus]
MGSGAILWALGNPKLNEREVLQAMLDVDEDLVADWPGLLIIADKGFASKEFENDLVMRGAGLLLPSFKREKKRRGEGLLKSVRQLIESVNATLKGQLDLEQHGGRTFEGVAVRVAQRIRAMAAATTRPAPRARGRWSHSITEHIGLVRPVPRVERRAPRVPLLLVGLARQRLSPSGYCWRYEDVCTRRTACRSCPLRLWDHDCFALQLIAAFTSACSPGSPKSGQPVERPNPRV